MQDGEPSLSSISVDAADDNVDVDANSKSEEKNFLEPLTDLELCAAKSHLEFSFEDIKNKDSTIRFGTGTTMRDRPCRSPMQCRDYSFQ
ncbi:unnamed protein product [Gongylonema pulchrum]|uniref:Uncharacterized protein n=1 Tax=Gongylonema pulchrum TaxID=637853 RepID=A0A3P7N8V4_9BILA|nr:unnamed protein product [Gongylonema pulchrum]